MSYTMTLDMPQREAAYVQRSPRLRRELNAIFVAIIQAKMHDNEEPLQGECADCCTGLEFLKHLRGTGPFLNDEEMHVFDRAKDYGRAIDLA